MHLTHKEKIFFITGSQEQESQSNEPAVSLRVIKRNTPNLARLQGLTEEERETQLQESRTAFEEEYVTMTDPTLQRLLALCAPLLNVDVNLERKYKHLDIWRVFLANKVSKIIHKHIQCCPLVMYSEGTANALKHVNVRQTNFITQPHFGIVNLQSFA